MGDVKQGGAVGTVLAAVGDLVLNSGEFVSFIVSWVVGNIDLLLPMFSTLRSQIAPRVSWLPAGVMDKLVFGAACLFLLILAYRLVKRTVGSST